MLVWFAVWLASGESRATDVYRERQIADDIATRTDEGEVIRLETAHLEYQGLYREAVSNDVHGGIILLHGRHSNQDAADLIRPLRQSLPEHGWSSLSLAMPLSNSDDLQDHADLLPAAIARLQSGVAFLKQKNIGNIALLAHDTGAWAASSYLAGSPDEAVRAAVLIDPAPSSEFGSPAISPANPNNIGIPILEILGYRSSATIDDEATRKRATMKNNASYRLLVLIEPGPGWRDTGDFLVNRIHGWLSHLQVNAGTTRATRPESRKPDAARDNL